ncbi:MAG: enoyl-CoA hydratase/isomerase family protein [Syntrophales bacterium]|nr:enoyl-CoA hydratase/isomerase family protein [Syntrophales bacterium]
MEESIVVKMGDGIAEVVMNRPDFFNAFNLEMISRLAEHLTMLAKDDSVRGLVLMGNGRAFCAGGDLKWALQNGAPYGSSFHTLAGQLNCAVRELRRMRKPVVAAIKGAAAGAGFSLALACDFRIMEKSAVLRQAYTSNGLCIDGGGSFILPRIVGMARAMEIMAFDQPISSSQSLAWGLATRIVENGTAREEAIRLLQEDVQGSLYSFGWSKKLMTDSFQNDFEFHIELEREGIADCAVHPDGEEGLKAFAEKRKPAFAKVA